MVLDLLLTNATVHTMDPGRPAARAIGIWHGHILGLDGDVSDLSTARTIDLAGATVLPGFHDAHCHTTSVGVEVTQLALGSAPDTDAVLERVAAHAGGLNAGAWVIGTGYLDRRNPRRHPTAAELDKAAGGRPVWLTHRSGHLCSVSTAVLSLLPDPLPEAARDFVRRDADGRPNGLLDETAMDLVKNIVGPASVADLVDAIDTATARYAAEGITSFTEAGIGCPGLDHSPLEIAAYQLAHAQLRMHARAQLMVYSELLHDLTGNPADAGGFGLDLGLRTGLGDPWLRVGAMKIWIDGAGTAGTAAVSGADGVRAVANFVDDPARMTAMIVGAHRAGWQVAGHAMGDSAVDLLLDALESAGPLPEVAARRHRIEHAGLIRPDQLERIARLGVVCVIQPLFITEFGDILAEHFGWDRVPWSLRAASLIEAGIVLAAGSDRPVAPGEPLAGIQAMLLRRTASGADYGPAERVGMADAIGAYTFGAAVAARSEGEFGAIAPGLLADLVVLDNDPLAADPSEIAQIGVLATMVGGCATHDPGSLIPARG